MREPPFQVARSSSETLDVPYKRTRDWRNQLRTNTKIDVHRSKHNDKVIRIRSPVYTNESGEQVFYRDCNTQNWWLADKTEFDKLKDECIGYFHIDICPKNPTHIKAEAAKSEVPKGWSNLPPPPPFPHPWHPRESAREHSLMREHPTRDPHPVFSRGGSVLSGRLPCCLLFMLTAALY